MNIFFLFERFQNNDLLSSKFMFFSIWVVKINQNERMKNCSVFTLIWFSLIFPMFVCPRHLTAMIWWKLWCLRGMAAALVLWSEIELSCQAFWPLWLWHILHKTTLITTCYQWCMKEIRENIWIKRLSLEMGYKSSIIFELSLWMI